MTLIKSISGIRGTIGGPAGNNLTPIDIVKFASAFGKWATQHHDSRKIVIGRDARPSGEMVSNLVSSTLIGMGIDIIDIGLSTTPTVEIAVPNENACGGIIITASHNPVEWNALKLLNAKGEFVSGNDGAEILEIAESESVEFAKVHKLGKITHLDSYLDYHIEKILKLPLVDIKAIKERNFHIAVDAVNSSGGIAVPKLLKALGVENILELFCETNGNFPHNPEPLPENLTTISYEVEKNRCDLGIVVDPDVDRLAFISEDGSMFGEEYTLVSIADYILSNTPGNTVSNLSSTRALRDVTEKHGGQYFASAVGEVNVVEQMKSSNAVIGGEGNGGVIYPELHYGRDALVGIALFLTHLAKKGKSCAQLKASYPVYHISKNKIELQPTVDVDKILSEIENKYKSNPVNTIDGVKIEFEKEWVHLRKSNTEPIIRIYAEAESETTADNLANKLIQDIHELIQT
ncbi:MAG: phosphoglucosamine mutase [Cyclobacteriaceae bacterium]|nr:phosphoglucosamine mutase [Cyclobacteriaceae bacterium]